MADRQFTRDPGNPIPFKAHDNGDGTFVDVVTSTSNTMFDGTLASAATAAALVGSSQPCAEVVVQNDPSNASGNDIYVGNATSQSMRLRPADSEILPVNDVNKVYVKAVAGTPRVNWHARS